MNVGLLTSTEMSTAKSTAAKAYSREKTTNRETLIPYIVGQWITVMRVVPARFRKLTKNPLPRVTEHAIIVKATLRKPMIRCEP